MAATRKPKPKGLLDDDQLRNAWVVYKDIGDRHMREMLILHYRPLVQAVAKRVGVTLPAHIDDEDLESYGLFGLMDAIEKFDLARGIKFETYASTRIRGAIIDELRSIDWIPRSVRSQVRDINQTYQALEGDLHRAPTDEELAEALGLTMAELHKQKGQQNFIHMVSLDLSLEDDPNTNTGKNSIGDQLHDTRSQSPDLAYEAEEIKNSLARSVSLLDEREAIVLCLYYYEGLTLAEIGQALNVTESRVCQMHTRAMSQVRGRLAAA
jgi:RNA polymerase sigma factor for flagellar operon FliA